MYANVPDGIHPRVAQSHLELHSTDGYRDAIRTVDSGQIASAIPHTYRDRFKRTIGQVLVDYHDFGFSHGLATREREHAFLTFDEQALPRMRRTLEGLLNRLQEDLRRQFRDTEGQWKKRANHDPHKTRLQQKMNELRRDATKVQSVDRLTFSQRIHKLAVEAYNFGYDKGYGVALANDRKARLGLPRENILLDLPVLEIGEDEGDVRPLN